MRTRLDQQLNHARSVEQVRDETLQQCRFYEQDILRLECLIETNSKVHTVVLLPGSKRCKQSVPRTTPFFVLHVLFSKLALSPVI